MGRFRTLPPTQKVKTWDEAQDCLADIGRFTNCGFDTETTGLSRQKDRPVILSLSTGHNRYAIWPEAIPLFKDYLEDPAVNLLGWNSAFDTWMLRHAGIDVYRHCSRTKYRVFDGMVGHALVYDDMAHDLKSAAKEYLGIDMVPFQKVYADGWGKRPLQELLLDPANEEVTANYAALDAYAHYWMFYAVREELLGMNAYSDHFNTMWDYYTQTELPFTRVLYECEREGVELDVDLLTERAPILDHEMVDIEKWFVRLTGNPAINLNSNDQLHDIFFNILELKPLAFTDEGNPQLTKAHLKRFADVNGIEAAEKLLNWRELKKQVGTYITGVMKLVHGGRVHTSFKQTGAKTGRLSSCIAKGTLIETVRDVSKYPKGVPIEDVKPGDQVYSFDDAGNLVIRRVLAAGRTGHRKVIRIHWQGDGRKHTGHLDLTPEHEVRTVNGEWVPAQNLSSGDRILSLSRGVTNYGYGRLYATGVGEIPREHRFIYKQLIGELPDHVHHVNHNKLDNRIENLEGMSATEHSQHHGANKSEGTKQKHSEASKKLWAENYGKMYAACARHGEDAHNYLGLTKDWVETALYEYQGKPKKVCDAYGIDYATFQKYMKKHGVDFWAIKAQFNSHGEKITKSFVERVRAMRDEGAKQKEMLRAAGMSYYRWAEVQKQFGYNTPYNHRVVRIEVLDEPVDVYDLTIEETKCFIAGELAVHNSDPNMQNLHPALKEAYVAADGQQLYARDYSQLEIRVLAHLSGEPALIDAIRAGQDVHCATAAMMYGLNYDAVKAAKDKDDADLPLNAREKELLVFRKGAKTLNFGIIYGMGKSKLSRELKLEQKYGSAQKGREEAQKLIDLYFERLPRAKEYMESAINNASERGFCTTFFGRRRQVPGVWSSIHGDVAAAERKIKNSPIQGGAAEICKSAMVRIYEDEDLRAAGYRMQLQIHDEIVGSVPDDMVGDKDFENHFIHLMENPLPFEFSVPLATTGKYGKNLSECK